MVYFDRVIKGRAVSKSQSDSTWQDQEKGCKYESDST